MSPGKAPSRLYYGEGSNLTPQNRVTNAPAHVSPSPETTYYLRSSVLGGQTVTAYDAAGARRMSYSYLDGEVLSFRMPDYRGTAYQYWRQANPVTGDSLTTDAAGVRSGATRLEATGTNVGETDPFTGSEETGGVGGATLPAGGESRVMALEPGWGGGGGGAGATRCYLDGIEMGCGVVRQVVERGAGVLAPTETIARVRVRYRDGTERSFVGTAYVTPGLDVTFTGYRAQAAAWGYNVGSLLYGFEAGVRMAIVEGLGRRAATGRAAGCTPSLLPSPRRKPRR